MDSQSNQTRTSARRRMPCGITPSRSCPGASSGCASTSAGSHRFADCWGRLPPPEYLRVTLQHLVYLAPSRLQAEPGVLQTCNVRDSTRQRGCGQLLVEAKATSAGQRPSRMKTNTNEHSKCVESKVVSTVGPMTVKDHSSDDDPALVRAARRAIPRLSRSWWLAIATGFTPAPSAWCGMKKQQSIFLKKPG